MYKNVTEMNRMNTHLRLSEIETQLSYILGEIKILAEDRSLLFDQEIMKYCMGNCIVLEDNNGNRKLLKERRDKKIDNVSALMDAYVAEKENLDFFV